MTLLVFARVLNRLWLHWPLSGNAAELSLAIPLGSCRIVAWEVGDDPWSTWPVPFWRPPPFRLYFVGH
jgi:hypothetical protein